MNFFCSQSGVTLLSASLLPPGVGTACTACFILHQIAFLMRAQLGFLPQMKFLKDAYGAILFSCHIYTGVMVERLKIMKLTYTQGTLVSTSESSYRHLATNLSWA